MSISPIPYAKANIQVRYGITTRKEEGFYKNYNNVEKNIQTHISLYYLPNVMYNINLTSMWLGIQKIIVWYEKKHWSGSGSD